MWQRFLHAFGCRKERLGTSPNGNPISRCTVCDSHYITYGKENAVDLDISAAEAAELLWIRKERT